MASINENEVVVNDDEDLGIDEDIAEDFDDSELEKTSKQPLPSDNSRRM